VSVGGCIRRARYLRRLGVLHLTREIPPAQSRRPIQRNSAAINSAEVLRRQRKEGGNLRPLPAILLRETGPLADDAAALAASAAPAPPPAARRYLGIRSTKERESGKNAVSSRHRPFQYGRPIRSHMFCAQWPGLLRLGFQVMQYADAAIVAPAASNPLQRSR